MLQTKAFQRHQRAVTAHSTGPAFRSGRIALKAQSSGSNLYCFDIDAVLSGLERLHARWGASAWQQLQHTADVVPGSSDLYVSTLQQLLSVVQHPAYESALLMRLLAEEGVVGSRSVSGREGPVVGRPVRHSGSRPLLVQEIIEHWRSEIKPTCLLRWGRQAAVTPEQLVQQLQQAYMQAQETLHWQVLDSQHVCHGSRSSRSSQAAAEAPVSSRAAPSNSSSSRTGRHPASAAATATIAAAAAAAGMVPCSESSVIIQPYTAVVQAICCCQDCIVIASTYPTAVTYAALAAAGLQVQGKHSVHILFGTSLAQCAQQLLAQQQQQHGAADGQQQCNVGVTFVVSSPSKARLVQQTISQEQLPQTADVAMSKHPQQHPPRVLAAEQPRQQVALQVGEWCCSVPSLRAKALASPHMDLLSECGLADVLGVSDSDAVMDGISWRQ